VNIAVQAEALTVAALGATAFLAPVTSPVTVPAGLGLALSAGTGALWGAIACP
jgi:hypothetical protein